MKFLISTFLLLLIICFYGFAQFEPAAGIIGSNAIHKDSSIIKSWATNCQLSRGYIKFSDTLITFTQNGKTSNKAFFGDENSPIGYPKDINDAVSLGDGGFAILKFAQIISDADGYDFVVFENGLKAQFTPFQYFLELAFVEVSSNGIDFVRFSAISNSQTETQISTYGQLNPENLHNFAGKYIVDYGTPFDLNELKDSTKIDINNITQIKIIDVIGSINDNYCSYDENGNKINDPYPTPFWTCGFDLAGIGLINSKLVLSENEFSKTFPNPFIDILNIYCSQNAEFYIFDINGQIIKKDNLINGNNQFNFNSLTKGLYIIKIISDNKSETLKIIKL